MEGFGSSSCGLGELKLIQGADREEKALQMFMRNLGVVNEVQMPEEQDDQDQGDQVNIKLTFQKKDNGLQNQMENVV